MGRYLVISSDCHAGLPNEEYRPYLDPRHRDALDDYLATRDELVKSMTGGADNSEFVQQWEEEAGEGLIFPTPTR